MKARLVPCLLVLAALAAPSARAEEKVASVLKGDRDLGEYLSSECVTCHQPSGKQVGAIPVIIGWPEDQFVAVMHSFKRRERDNQVMQTMASRLSDEEMAALAAYFGSLKPGVKN
ncbi:MAG: c-type cytochrome [Proteobacteria bacterium]|nr:c-type cytochrome [Pseudomonadota bacterium]